MSTPTVSRGAELDTWVRFLRAHSAIVGKLNAELVADHGLTINDFEVLLHLSWAPEQAMRRVDLASSVLLTPSGITRLLDGLERSGFVARESLRHRPARRLREADPGRRREAPGRADDAPRGRAPALRRALQRRRAREPGRSPRAPSRRERRQLRLLEREHVVRLRDDERVVRRADDRGAVLSRA